MFFISFWLIIFCIDNININIHICIYNINTWPKDPVQGWHWLYVMAMLRIWTNDYGRMANVRWTRGGHGGGSKWRGHSPRTHVLIMSLSYSYHALILIKVQCQLHTCCRLYQLDTIRTCSGHEKDMTRTLDGYLAETKDMTVTYCDRCKDNRWIYCVDNKDI